MYHRENRVVQIDHNDNAEKKNQKHLSIKENELKALEN